MARSVTVEDVIGKAVTTRLPAWLATLEPGDEIFFIKTKDATAPFSIRLSHPNAPHQPEMRIDWITADGSYLLIHAWRLDPDSEERSLSTLVRLIERNAIRIIDERELARAEQALRAEVAQQIHNPRDMELSQLSLLARYIHS
jgi:hypothetical protein